MGNSQLTWIGQSPSYPETHSELPQRALVTSFYGPSPLLVPLLLLVNIITHVVCRILKRIYHVCCGSPKEKPTGREAEREREVGVAAIVAQVAAVYRKLCMLHAACGLVLVPPGAALAADSFKFGLPPSGLSRFRATCMQSARYSCSAWGI